jgi:hypothetical protein
LATEIIKSDCDVLEDILFGNVSDINILHKTLDKIISNIEKISKNSFRQTAIWFLAGK